MKCKNIFILKKRIFLFEYCDRCEKPWNYIATRHMVPPTGYIELLMATRVVRILNIIYIVGMSMNLQNIIYY
jgi:hypothetical protein